MNNEQEQIRKANEDIKRAELARQVIDNPVFQESFTLFKVNCFDRFTKTKFDNVEEREEIWRKLQTLEFVESNLKNLIENGEFARETLSLIERAKKVVGL